MKPTPSLAEVLLSIPTERLIQIHENAHRSIEASKKLITASNVSSLLELLYVILVDHIQSGEGKPKPDTALEINSLAPSVLKTWGHGLPTLKPALQAVLNGKNKVEYLADLGVSMKTLLPQARQDGTLNHEDLEIFAAFASFFRTNSQTALAKLQKLASASGSPWVVQHMAPPVGDQGSTKAALEALVEGLVGRKDTVLTLDEAQRIKEMKPEEYKSYLALRKTYNQAWRDSIVSYIRSSGEHHVPYTDVLNFLKLNGIDHLMPVGFTGLMDDRMRLYTRNGKMIDGMPNAVTFPIVTMNPNYGKPDGGDWVFRADRANKQPGPYFYTSDFKKAASKAKFAKVAILNKKMDGMRKKWIVNVKRFNIEDPKCVASVILELLYEFSARIGSIGNAAGGTATYGIGTLLVKHAIIDPSGNITLRYKGKDGVATTHKLLKADPEQRFLIADLHELIDGKDPKALIFTTRKNGKDKFVPGGFVNSYFKSLGAGEATVHKIRTYHGTKLFQEMLNAQDGKRQPKNEKEAMALLKKMAEVVGKKLNHVRRGASGTKVTGTTALAAYIDPVLQVFFFQNLGLRLPKFLEKYDV